MAGFAKTAFDDYSEAISEHPVLVVGSGALAGGVAGLGAHALGTRIATAPSRREIARYHENIGKAYEEARKLGGHVPSIVEADLKRSGVRGGLEKSLARNSKILGVAKKLRAPVGLLGALAGGALAYNHFYG